MSAGPYKLITIRWLGSVSTSDLAILGGFFHSYGFTSSEMSEISRCSRPSDESNVIVEILLNQSSGQVSQIISGAVGASLSYEGNIEDNVISLGNDHRTVDPKEFWINSDPGFDTEEMSKLLNQTYFEFADQLRIQSNNVANVLTAVDLVRKIKKPASLLESTANYLKKGKFGVASDAWLKYRYVYNTTMSDIRAHCEALLALRLTERETFVMRKAFTQPVDTHVKFVAIEDLSAITDAQAIWIKIQQLGLQPDLYNLWDLIPFSFVIDWILPVGDKLEALQKYTWLKSMPYRTLMLVSHKGIGVRNGEEFEYYVRYSFQPDDTTIFTQSSSATTKTWVKRGIDLIALA